MYPNKDTQTFYWRFITRDNEAIMFSPCVFVTCQNFFEILQVCSSDGLSVCLLLAKIFNFGKYVRLTVCVFVCVFVCP